MSKRVTLTLTQLEAEALDRAVEFVLTETEDPADTSWGEEAWKALRRASEKLYVAKRAHLPNHALPPRSWDRY